MLLEQLPTDLDHPQESVDRRPALQVKRVDRRQGLLGDLIDHGIHQGRPRGEMRVHRLSCYSGRLRDGLDARLRIRAEQPVRSLENRGSTPIGVNPSPPLPSTDLTSVRVGPLRSFAGPR